MSNLEPFRPQLTESHFNVFLPLVMAIFNSNPWPKLPPRINTFSVIVVLGPLEFIDKFGAGRRHEDMNGPHGPLRFEN